MSPLPDRAGLGLKPEHYAEILASRPNVGFFEVHAENYMGAGGPPLRYLEQIAENYPLSLHGVGLSIGSAGALDKAHIRRLQILVQRFDPASFSEHLAWSTHESAFLSDLLPLPYTNETLHRVVEHVDEVQQTLGRQMLLENPATYVLFQESTIDEIDFLTSVSDRTGCGLLLDVNNVMVSAVNHRLDPYAYIDRFPLHRVGEIHLAGYDEAFDSAGDLILIDTHGSAVLDDVIALYIHTLGRSGPRPTLVEWDNNIPDWRTLFEEAKRVDGILADNRIAPETGLAA